MARHIGQRKTALRAVVTSIHHGDLVLTVAEEGIWFREKGRRTAYLLPHGVAFQRAVDLHVQRERADRKLASRARRRR